MMMIMMYLHMLLFINIKRGKMSGEGRISPRRQRRGNDQGEMPGGGMSGGKCPGGNVRFPLCLLSLTPLTLRMTASCMPRMNLPINESLAFISFC